MELKIDKQTTIREVQREFNTFYPYLKIEFFTNPNPENKPSPRWSKISGDASISRLIGLYESGSINMDGGRTVAQIEKEFWETFGLSAQVFRKSGNLWIETSLTDSWTLDKQNEEGRLFNSVDERSLDQKIEDDLPDAD